MAFSANDADHDLIAAAQRGERSALDVLVRRHDPWVRRVVYATVGNPWLVDDVVQQVWTRVWQQIGSLANRERWRGWLYRMARNAAIDAGQQTARRRRRHVALADDEVVASRRAGPLRRAQQTEEHRHVLGAVNGLPTIYREPFVLRHLEDWSYAQIAEALGLKIDTVETRLVRARRLLREALRERSPD